MNIEDLEYALAAAEINIDITNKKIKELDENRYQKFNLVGQERQQNPKTEEQISLEEENQKYVIEKNRIINLIGMHDSLLKQANESDNMYQKYSIAEFESLRDEFDNKTKELDVKIKELEENRYQKFNLVGQERQQNPKTEEQISLEKERLQNVQNFQKIVNIIGAYNSLKNRISEIDSLKDDMTKYVTEYSNIIYQANKIGLPAKLITDLMEQNMKIDQSNKMSDEEKEKLREKLTQNIDDIRKRKENKTKIEPDGKPKEDEKLSQEEKDNLKEKLYKNIVQSKQNKENKTDSSKPINFMSEEEIKEEIKKQEKHKEEIDSKIIKIDLNAEWGNTSELMDDYVRTVKFINELKEKLPEEKKVEKEEIEETKLEEEMSPKGNGNDSYDLDDLIKLENESKKSEMSRLKAQEIEAKVNGLKNTWKGNSVFKRALNRKKKPNWKLIRQQLAEGADYDVLRGGMSL